MLISVINHTRGRKKVGDRELQDVIRAINRQIEEDFAPVWGMTARLRLEGRAQKDADEATNADMRGDAILYLLTTVADAGDALGFHDLNNSGVPFGFVYTELSEENGEDWSVTLSHEALELIADPEANLLVMGPHPDDEHTVFHWFEMCDAVQAETYKIDGITLSNFVLPLYFTGTRDVDEPGARNNFLGTPLPSFGVTPGGYVGFYDPKTGDMGDFHAAHDALAEHRMKVKAQAMKTRRANRYKAAGAKTRQRAAVAAPAPATEAAGEIAASQLRAGDVLLYRREGWLSDAIRFFDGRPVSHAAIYLGANGVGEALGHGVLRTNLHESVQGTEWVMARRLGKDVAMKPVIDRAAFYLGEGERYAYEQILLLAFLGITRKVAPTGVAGLLLRKILDEAAAALNRLIASITDGKKEPMICSEFVYRCFEEADAARDDDYTIRIGRAARGRRALDSSRGRGIERGSLLEVAQSADAIIDAPQHHASGSRLGIRASASEASIEELFAEHKRQAEKVQPRGEINVTADLHRSLSQFAYALHGAQARTSRRRAAASPKAALDHLLATVKDFVTPGDLYDSPSLVTKGRIAAVVPIAPAEFKAAFQRAARTNGRKKPSVS